MGPQGPVRGARVVTEATPRVSSARVRCRPGRKGDVPGGTPIYSVMYIVWNVGMPRTLSLYMPPILEPRMIAVPA